MTTAAKLTNNTVVPAGYALGVNTAKIWGQPAVSHGGAVLGYLSFLLYLSNQEIAVAVITNGFPAPAGGESEAMAVTIAKAALDTL